MDVLTAELTPETRRSPAGAREGPARQGPQDDRAGTLRCHPGRRAEHRKSVVAC